MKYTTVLFDLDGTLTRSEEGITRSALYACNKLGFNGYTQEAFKAFIGPPLYDSFRTIVGMSDAQAKQAMQYYRERFSSVGWAENEVYRGIASLLRSLKMNGARVAIATAKPQVFAERIAARFGLAPWLDGVIGPGFDTTHSSKSEVIARAVETLGGVPVMVGDRMYDIDGAKSVGIDSVGVTYGYGSEEELTSAGATHIAHSVEELEDLLLDGAPRCRGVFFSLEGIDGCGKTTQREHVANHLRQMGWAVQMTREPGGDEMAEKIRALLLDPANRCMCAETEAYLYAAGRAQNVRMVIRPALERGMAVVSDRFVDSSIGYQGGGRELGTQAIAALNALAVGETWPDMTLYLRMCPEDALKRRLRTSKPDRLEREQLDFFRRTYQAFETCLAVQPRTVCIDAAQPVEDVTRDVLAAVDAQLASMSTLSE